MLLPKERVSERLLEKKRPGLPPSGTVEDALVFHDGKLELDSRQRQKDQLADARDHGGVEKAPNAKRLVDARALGVAPHKLKPLRLHDEEARLDKFA